MGVAGIRALLSTARGARRGCCALGVRVSEKLRLSCKFVVVFALSPLGELEDGLLAHSE